MTRNVDQLRSIQTFEQLIPFLEQDLDWPFPDGRDYEFDDLTFEYTPDELGLEDDYAAKIKRVHQLRPLASGQPWGIFFVEFENKKLPIVVLRRILSHLVLKQRRSANPADRARWNAGDLLFISAFAEEGTSQREIAFAHFHQDPGDQPTLRVLGWDGGDTPLKLEHVSQLLKQRLSWPKNPGDHAAWRKQWAGAFRYKIGEQIRTANLLARELARVARNIRDAAIALMKVESAKGPLRRMHEAFRTALIHDLTQEGFADTYAQTITYGLLTAAISRTDRSAGADGTFVLAEDIHNMVPITNPFLKEMLESFLKVGGRGTSTQSGLDFDELGVQEVVEMLRSSDVNLPAVLEDFGNRNPGEDPVIRFYEDFLQAYNKELKIKRGVFYTPQPVVSYIVRSVHELLQTEFGLPDGLASTTTWAEVEAQMAARGKSFTVPEGTSSDTPFVIILDPATGTATFLVEVIEVVFRTLTQRWTAERLTPVQQRNEWNRYVPVHLLPRLFGYELMMAPYAIAHMKLGLKLHETGYDFVSEERVRVYLTNTLEPPHDFSNRLAFYVPALAHEAEAVNLVKSKQRFTVVLGNPPYSGLSANLTPSARAIVERYKYIAGERIRERGALQFEKNLQDDYVKFLAWSESTSTSTGQGILAFITNNGFLETPTLRGMRWSLLNSFSAVSVLDLHGSAKHHVAGDENVFDIQQGVAITVLVKSPTTPNNDEGILSRSDWLFGRDAKYAELEKETAWSLRKKTVTPRAPLFQFLELDQAVQSEYSQFTPLPELMPFYSSGTETGFDALMTDFTCDELINKLNRFVDLATPDGEIIEEFGVREGTGRKLFNLRDDLREDIVSCGRERCFEGMYRVFDSRYYYYKKEYLKTNSWRVMQHLAGKKNIALVAFRQQSQQGFHHAFVTDRIGDKNAVSLRTREINYYFPLMLFPEESSLKLKSQSVANFSEHHLRSMRSWNETDTGANRRLAQSRYENVFRYLYAILHSPVYRARYGAFLKSDFPRLPLNASTRLFEELSTLGEELIGAHLLATAQAFVGECKYIGQADPAVERIAYIDNRVWLNRQCTNGFAGISDAIWTFEIGGYQVAEKWLKDRVGRTLCPDEVTHYCKIVRAVSETIRIMEKIDEAIEEQGGWPGAFA